MKQYGTYLDTEHKTHYIKPDVHVLLSLFQRSSIKKLIAKKIAYKSPNNWPGTQQEDAHNHQADGLWH
jgi:hypothetical protein